MPSRLALTLIELLVVLTIIAILTSIAVATSTRHGAAARAARDVATAVRATRWAAVAEGRPVVLLAQPSGGLARTPGGGFACTLDGTARTIWEHTPGVLVGWPTRGVAFAPDGRPRRCDGAGAGNTTVTVVSRSGDRAAVIVSITGRIRWERR